MLRLLLRPHRWSSGQTSPLMVFLLGQTKVGFKDVNVAPPLDGVR